MLVRDINGDGQISSGKELFGSETLVAIRQAQDGESGAGCVRYTASPARISLDLEYQAKALDTPGRLGTF